MSQNVLDWIVLHPNVLERFGKCWKHCNSLPELLQEEEDLQEVPDAKY